MKFAVTEVLEKYRKYELYHSRESEFIRYFQSVANEFVITKAFEKTLLSILLMAGAVMIGSPANAQTKRGAQSEPAQVDRAPVQPQSSDPTATGVLAEVNKDYLISPGDVIEVSVDDAPELSRNYRVNAAGTFEMQFVGQIVAKQQTTEDLARLIAKKLREQDYLKSPNVVVTVRQYNSQTFFIQGAVSRPGVYQIEGNPSLLMMIGIAGGLNDNHGSTAFIIRRCDPKKQNPDTQNAPPPEHPKTQTPQLDPSAQSQNTDSDPVTIPDYELVRVNLNALYKGHFDQNQRLEPGDIVNIPRADVFFVAGEVQAPGSFPLKDGTTLRQAISLAQGMTFKAKPGNGLIFREDPESGKRQELKVDIGAVMSGKKEDITILANDVVIIPNSRTKSVGGAMLMAFGLSASRVPIRY